MITQHLQYPADRDAMESLRSMLGSAKGSIDVHVWAGMPHVFLSSIAIVTAADEALDDIGALLRESFDRG